MQEHNGRKYLKYVGIVIVIFCVLFTAVVGGFAFTNINHIGRFVRVLQLIESQYLEKTTSDQLVDGATKGIVESLGDPYSSYMNAEENQQLFDAIEGRFGGVGIVLSLKDPTKLIVLKTIKGGPADKAGIEAGDQIVKIDSTNATTIDSDKAVTLMRGDPGTKVTLGIYREKQNKNLSVTLTRDNINVPTVEGEALPGDSDIAYIDISQFATDTGTELTEVLKNMDIKKYKGLILDLRYNHGGELNAAVDVAGYFIPPGPVVYIVDNKEKVDTKTAGGDNYLGMPLVVLVNEETASAAEIVSGAIKDKKTGTLVGVKTFGKGIVQTIFPLDGGTSVKLTTAKYLTPNKISIHKIGIEPDVKVELGKDEQAVVSPQDTKFDTQLQKAVETLKAEINK